MPDPLPNSVSEEPMLNSLPVLSYPPVLPTVMSHSSSPSGSPPIRTKPPITPVDHKSVSPNPVSRISEIFCPQIDDCFYYYWFVIIVFEFSPSSSQ